MRQREIVVLQVAAVARVAEQGAQVDHRQVVQVGQLDYQEVTAWMQAVQVKPLVVLAAVLAAAVRSLTVMEAIKVKLAAAEAVAYCQVRAVLAETMVLSFAVATVGMRVAREATVLALAEAEAEAAGVLVAEAAVATIKVAAVLVVQLYQVQPLLHTLTTAQFMDQQHEFYRAKI